MRTCPPVKTGPHSNKTGVTDLELAAAKAIRDEKELVSNYRTPEFLIVIWIGMLHSVLSPHLNSQLPFPKQLGDDRRRGRFIEKEHANGCFF